MIPKNVQTEIDASYLYQRLAEHESDAEIAEVFSQMSEIEKTHALAFMKNMKLDVQAFPPPSFRARTLDRIGRLFGYNVVLGMLMDTEKSISNAIVAEKEKKKLPLTGGETSHVRILRNILEKNQNISGNSLTRFESRHRSVGGNAIRAAVLGGNDGLVSNFSLVMGVAGASEGQSGVLLAGVAGLLAGALSMALGEWISVKSSQELYENQMKLEMEELEVNPEGEMRELALIYRSKGIPADQAMQMAGEMIKDKSRAHEMLVREELGINTEELKGSAMEAALFSFFLFAIGAVIPVAPFFFSEGMTALYWSVGLSALGLFLIGSAITLFTGRSLWFSGFRQMLFGLAAAGITYLIGSLIGVSLAG